MSLFTVDMLPKKDKTKEGKLVSLVERCLSVVKEQAVSNGEMLAQCKGWFDTLIKGIFELKAEVVELKAEVVELKAEVVELKAEVVEQGKRITKLEKTVANLVNELSRYKNDSDDMLMSIYAFCKLNCIHFSYGNDRDEDSLAHKGKLALNYSKKHGYYYNTTLDPRFGQVYLYDQRALENLFLGDED